ncbi:NOG1 family protein [Thermoproteota archaeon]
MNFQDLKNIETSEWYLDLAFSSAKKKSDNLRGSLRGGKHTRIEKSKKVELEKLKTINRAITRQLNMILRSFPSIDSLPEFYNELIRCTLEYDKLKKALGGAKWGLDKINHFTTAYATKIKRCQDLQKINAYRREYYGRISSIMNQVNKNLLYLETARKIMKDYPSVKTETFTVCIAGFPNVGKTTLLQKVTGAKAEINEYAFTTKRLNMGYYKNDYVKIQFIDTPGTLNRFNKMNDIEKQAYLAIRYCADVVVYVFDLTEPYPLSDQKKLLKSLEKFDKDTIIYLSKTDILEKETVDAFLKKNKNVFTDKDKIMDVIQKKAQKSGY